MTVPSIGRGGGGRGSVEYGPTADMTDTCIGNELCGGDAIVTHHLLSFLSDFFFFVVDSATIQNRFRRQFVVQVANK